MVITLLAAFLMSDTASIHRPDTSPLRDPSRMVSEITQTSFSLQYATATPCETRVEYRQGDALDVLGKTTPNYRVTPRGAGMVLWHTIDISGLKPGKRYYYRVYDGSSPTSTEAEWGAASPWSREYAVSTEAPTGRKTIIHIPVKVLLMPNVVSAESAVQPDGSIAPDPPKTTSDQLAHIKDEYKVASRVFWADSGMRLWVDFHFVVDDRWQRWGPPAEGASAFFQNLPECRSYAGSDYVEPGGGTFTFVDGKNPSVTNTTPVHDGFACQIEQAWPRRWDPVLKVWKFYASGGATQGVDDLPKGVPARSQFLAGSDTAWLVANEFHHQLESLGAFSLGNSEDDRIVSDKPSPRHRNPRGDGTFSEQDWNTTGPHGEFWDAIRYWDKQVTDCQWLRLAFGTTETVVDKKGTGFPNDDPWLPMDLSRFKSIVGFPSYESACNFDYVWVPLQPSWLKKWDDSRVEERNDLSGTRSQTNVVERGNGHFTIGKVFAFPADAMPKLVLFHAPMDADPQKWESVYAAGRLLNEMTITFKQAYDDAGYYGLITANGPVGHIDIDLDGEGKGMFTPPGALGFTITNLKPSAGQAGPNSLPVSVKITTGGQQGRAPWLTWKAVRKADGTLIFEFKVPNGGDGPWYWQGAGHQIGVAINAYDADGHGYSMGEPYKLYYSRMVETRGREPRPPAPAPLDADEVSGKPGDVKVFPYRSGYEVVDNVTSRIKGAPAVLMAGGLKANDFDLTVTVEGAGDITIGGYADQTPRPDADRDYSLALIGGKASLHVFGHSDDPEPVQLGSGIHKLQIMRRTGGVWILIDGKVRGYSRDPSPRLRISKLGLFVPGDSAVNIREVSYRIGTSAPSGDR